MLTEIPFSSSWDLETALRISTEYLRQSEWALVAVVACGAIASGAMLKVVLDLRAGRRTNVRAKCKWKLDKLQPSDELRRWVCSVCGGIAFSDGRKPPVNCRKYDPRSRF